eukprot:SAG31_NODE_3305_length_4438_cov_5.790505_2_plen_98_part_00
MFYIYPLIESKSKFSAVARRRLYFFKPWGAAPQGGELSSHLFSPCIQTHREASLISIYLFEESSYWEWLGNEQRHSMPTNDLTVFPSRCRLPWKDPL